MKSTIHEWMLLICGAVVGGLISFLVARQFFKKAAESLVETRVARQIEESDLLDVSSLVYAMDLARSNQMEKLKVSIANRLWWSLEDAWIVNKKLGGIYDDKIQGLLTNVYPEVRKEVRKEVSFDRIKAGLPLKLLTEVTNFVNEADSMQSK